MTDENSRQSSIPAIPFPSLEEFRCQCGKLFFRGILQVGLISIKCKRCKRLTTFKGSVGVE